MNIWNDIEIRWKGELYTVRPTLALINRLERGDGMSITSLLIRINNRDLPSGLACELIARVLNHAGVNVEADEIYAETGGIGADVVTMASAIIVGCLPTPKSAGAVEKKQQSQKKSNGPKSTGSR